jgi:pseudaminic acid cytidylyltransferase
MTKRIAIIPARGGSKRIAGKNIRDFCGRPMIGHILEVAQASGLFTVIHVSTESESIRRVVEDLGVPVAFMRPAEIADDHTPIMPVLRHVVDAYAGLGETFDQVWLLMACSPLLDAGDLRGAAELFESCGSRDPLLAVAEYPAPVEWAFSRAADGRLTPLQPGMFAVRSQDLPKKYFDSGSFVAYPAQMVSQSEGAGSDHAFISYVLGKGKAVDIDDEADWKLAEALYRALKQRPASAAG